MSPILGILDSAKYGTLHAGNFYAIASATVTSGGSGSNIITFSSIPQTYTHLQIRLFSRANRAANLEAGGIAIQGPTYANNQHILYGDGSSATATSSFGLLTLAGESNTSGVFSPAIIDVFDYTNTNKNKVVKASSGYDNNGSGYASIGSALILSTNAITSISVYAANSTAFDQYTSVALYGIK